VSVGVRRGPIGAVAEVWAYRNLVLNLAQRELRSRYKKSVLGWLWSLINPASSLLVYSFVFGVFLRVEPPEMANGEKSFALYLFCALVMWNFFSQVVNGSMSALATSGSLLHKVYFPAACPAIANVLTTLIQIAIEMAILIVVMIVVGNVSWTFLLLPVAVALLAVFSLGVGLAVSMFNVFFRDVGYLVAVVLNIWFYATPIVYTLEYVKDYLGEDRLWIWELNPLTQFVELSRDLLYLHTIPSPTRWAYVVLVSFGTLALGWWIFERKARELAEEL
jgi:ABC-2 type transport system permease protein